MGVAICMVVVDVTATYLLRMVFHHLSQDDTGMKFVGYNSHYNKGKSK